MKVDDNGQGAVDIVDHASHDKDRNQTQRSEGVSCLQ
jgi:hypothetical protein